MLLVAGATYYAGWTEGGLQRLAALASRRLGPVTLSIVGARGTLHGGLHVDRVEVDHQRVRVIARDVDGRIALLPLLWQTIRVSRLDIGDVYIQVLPHTGPPGEPWQPHFLAGLLNIEVAKLSVGHAELVAPGGTTLEATQLRAAAEVGAKEIRVFDSTLNYSGFEIRSAGTVHATQSLRMQGPDPPEQRSRRRSPRGWPTRRSMATSTRSASTPACSLPSTRISAAAPTRSAATGTGRATRRCAASSSAPGAQATRSASSAAR